MVILAQGWSKQEKFRVEVPCGVISIAVTECLWTKGPTLLFVSCSKILSKCLNIKHGEINEPVLYGTANNRLCFTLAAVQTRKISHYRLPHGQVNVFKKLVTFVISVHFYVRLPGNLILTFQHEKVHNSVLSDCWCFLCLSVLYHSSENLSHASSFSAFTWTPSFFPSCFNLPP